MKKQTFSKVEESLYYEKLDNGLEIYMVPKKDNNNCYVTYTTRYGSFHTEFIPFKLNKYKKFPDGIAHFLEHKMFEQESGVDPFTFFAETGADANAMTSFAYTTYLFSASNQVQENLAFLLDFVGSPYFTLENVEKEKGIIEQEINMGNDNPLWVLQEGLRANAFGKYPVNKSIGGTVASIRSITKDDLYDCYNTFYHPTNMFLVMTGNFDKDEMLTIIKENQAKKNWPNREKIQLKKYEEPVQVIKEYEEKEMVIEVPKVSVGIKIALKKLNKIDLKIINLYLGMMGYILFGKASSFYERMQEEELLVSDLVLNKILVVDYALAIISAESDKPNELINEIKKALTKIKITKEDFERQKRVLLSNYILIFNDVTLINSKIMDNLIKYHKIYYDEYEIINSLSYEKMQEFIKKLDLTNVTAYVIRPKKEK